MGLLDKMKKGKAAKEAKDAAPVKATKKAAVKTDDPSVSTDKAAKKTKKTTTKKAAPKKPAATKTAGASEAYRILLRPVLSEKTTAQEAQGQYTFIVASRATKIDVKKASEAVYSIRPVRVNMIHTDGKETRFGRYSGRRKDVKKAIVTVPKDKKLDIHEGV